MSSGDHPCGWCWSMHGFKPSFFTQRSEYSSLRFSVSNDHPTKSFSQDKEGNDGKKRHTDKRLAAKWLTA